MNLPVLVIVSYERDHVIKGLGGRAISNQTAEEYRDMIERVTTKIVDSKMESIVVFFLESFRPMASLWSQLLRLYVGPFLMIIGVEKVETLFKFLEKPENLEYFISKIEEKSVDKVDSKRH